MFLSCRKNMFWLAHWLSAVTRNTKSKIISRIAFLGESILVIFLLVFRLLVVSCCSLPNLKNGFDYALAAALHWRFHTHSIYGEWPPASPYTWFFFALTPKRGRAPCKPSKHTQKHMIIWCYSAELYHTDSPVITKLPEFNAVSHDVSLFS